MRTWETVRATQSQNSPTLVWGGVRNDGQMFYSKFSREDLDTFLSDECICQIPPVEGECPIHPSKPAFSEELVNG